MKPTSTLLLALLCPLAPAAPVAEPKDTLTLFTYRLTLFSSTSCGGASSAPASLSVTPSGPNVRFAPLLFHPVYPD